VRVASLRRFIRLLDIRQFEELPIRALERLRRAARMPLPTLYVANQGVTMKLRFGGKAVPT